MAKKIVTIIAERSLRGKVNRKNHAGTLTTLHSVFSYTLACGAWYQKASDKKKINRKPRTTKSLLENLNKAGEIMKLNGYKKASYLEG